MDALIAIGALAVVLAVPVLLAALQTASALYIGFSFRKPA